MKTIFVMSIALSTMLSIAGCGSKNKSTTPPVVEGGTTTGGTTTGGTTTGGTTTGGTTTGGTTTTGSTADSGIPTVSSVTSSKTNGSYKAGDVIAVTVTFSEVVTVTGTPQLTFETGSTDAIVNYTSGSGTTTLTFNYTVASGHTSADLDYVATTSLALNSGTILDSDLVAATLTLASPAAANSLGASKAIVIDTTVPTITYTSVSPTSPSASQTPTVTLSLSEASSTATLGLFSESGCTTSIATAVTGVSGSNAVTTTSLTANSTTTIYAKVTDVAGNASVCTSMLSYVHDSSAVPTVTAVTSTKTNGSYTIGEVIGITVTFSTSVTVTGTPQITLETGGTDAVVNYTSGSPGTTLTFNYTVAATHTSSDLDYQSTTALALNSGTIRDASLNNATLTLVSPSTSTGATIANGKAIVIDTTVPVITYTSINPTTPGTSQTPAVTLSLSEAGSTTSLGLFSESGCTSSIATAVTGTSGSNAVTTTSLTANSTTTIYAKVTDVAGNASVCTSMVSYVHDNTVPTVTAVTSTKADGSYKVGEVIGITVTFSKSVTVTGTPQITLETGGTDAVVNYTSGSPGTVLTFNYTVAASETSADLDYASTTALALNSGTIRDASLNNATLTLVSPSTSTGATIANGKAIVIDTTAPTVAFSSVSVSNPGSTLTPTILGTGSETSTVTLYYDASCVTAKSAGTANTTFASPGIAVNANVGSNTTTTIYGKAVDTALNASACTSLVTYTHDNVAPVVSVSAGVSSDTANGSYKQSGVIAIKVTFSESVTVTGTPQLTLETGGSDAVVDYTSGSGSTVLVFNYTVAATHTSADLDYASTTALALNSGTIKDSALNAATLTLATVGAANSLGANNNFVIDTTVPTITYTSISPASPGSSQTPAVTLSLSEASGTTGLGLYSESGCGTSIATAVTGTSGSNAVTTTSLTSGSTTTIYAKATDVAGNVSTCTSMVSYTHSAGGGGGGGANSWTATTTTSAPTGRYGTTAIWTGSKMIVWGGLGGSLLNTGGLYDPVANSWSATTTTSAPTARYYHLAIWTGSKMIVWGGGANTGGRYDPVLDSWTATTTTSAPTARSFAAAVWTGSKMIVWGGSGAGSTGGIYDPVANTWTATTTTSAPGGRYRPSAVWTGSKMIVWGGDDDDSGYDNTGGVYDSVANTWTATTTTSAPSARTNHTAIWTGSKMVIWGGVFGGYINTGGSYDAVANSWTATTTTSAPASRSEHTAIWTGAKMIVYGGNSGSALNSGGLYDPAANSWSATTTTDAPPVRSAHTSVWTGSQMIVWGGYSSINTGGVYTPDAASTPNSWSATATTSVPAIRNLASSVWTGSKMIVWGGAGPINTGGQYDPVANSWTATTTTSAPAARTNHTAVWTGSKMIVWGGAGPLSTGGLYDPVTNAWTATTSTNVPTARFGHAAVWTGSVMIVWGAAGGGLTYETGSKYNPAANTWTAMDDSEPTYTTIISADFTPAETRSGQSAVWTGSKMIVFGGQDTKSENTYIGTTNVGGVYDPAANTWTATTTTNAPAVRSFHSAVWTGSKMVVWGGLSSIGSTGGAPVNTGGLYDPVANTWTATTSTSVPTSRQKFSAVWTGAKMIVWGGGNGTNVNTGGLYDPVANSWTATTSTSVPTIRDTHSAVWTGGQMIIWGGTSTGSTYLNTGGIYTPSINTTSSCSGGGVSIGGHCWYSSGTNVSCSTACSNVSLTYNTATLTYAGTSGTLAQCKAVLDGVFGGNNTVVDVSTGSACMSGVGCGVESTTTYERCTMFATTDTSGSGVFNRVCACQ